MTTQIDKLGQSLRERREQLGLSQRRLAEEVGIRHTHVSRVERGESGVSLNVLSKLADVLQVPPQWLISESVAEAPAPKLRSDELNEEEAAMVSLYRMLPKSDRRFLVRWLVALVRQPRAAGSGSSGHWRPVAAEHCVDPDPSRLHGGDGISAMTIRGDELSGLGLRDGDLVATSTRQPLSGDVVVALVDDVETVVRIWKPNVNGTVELAPTSEDKSLIAECGRVEIQSVVTHVWREREF